MIMQKQPDGTYEQIGFIKSSDGENIDTIVDATGDVYFTQGFTKDITGVPPFMLDAIGKPLTEYRIYGNSVQDGTPSPENPIKIQSVGELVTEGEFSGKYRIPVVVSGKNLMPPFINGIYIDPTTGNATNKSTSAASDFVMINPEKTYYLTLYDKLWSLAVFYDKDKKYISRSVFESRKYVIFEEFPENTRYIRVNQYENIHVDGKIGDFDVNSLQLEIGDTATHYEPYKEPITTNIYLDEPLMSGDVLKYPENVIEHSDGTTKSIILPQIPTINGTTVISVDTNIQPSNMYVKYKGKKKQEETANE